MSTTQITELDTQVNIATPATEIFIAVDVLFIVATIIGNSIIIGAVHNNKQLRSPSIIFIISVAVSHILVGVVVLPMFILSHFPDDLVTSISCKIFAYLTKFASTASLAAIFPLTLDVFLRNKGYYNCNSLSWTRAVLQVALTWTFAAGYAVLHCVLVEFQIVTGEDAEGRWHTKVCHVRKDKVHLQKILVLVDVSLLFVLPVLFLSILTGTILYWHWRRTLPETLDRAERERRRLNTRTSTIFLVVFTIFNVGNYMINVYIFWGPGSFRHIHLWTSICTLVGYGMCWVNVVMILIFNKTFRPTFFGKVTESPSNVEMDVQQRECDNEHNANQTQLTTTTI